jgi:hypothetical protein
MIVRDHNVYQCLVDSGTRLLTKAAEHQPSYFAECPTGCVPVNSNSGWSSRLMFHDDGSLKSYLYYPGMSGTASGCGESREHNRKMSTDTWYSIQMVVNVNTGGALTLLSVCA